MSDINASLGYSQLNKLDGFVKKRNLLAGLYINKLSEISDKVKIIQANKNIISSYHLLIMLIDFKKLKIKKDKLIYLLNKSGIYPQYHYDQYINFHIINFYKEEKNLNPQKNIIKVQ